ncbi:CesT family type III secretion system chaperone [Alcaligenes sp. Marseille-Q7550]
MSDTSMFAKLMADFGRALGIAHLAPSAEGVCQFWVDGRHLVQVVDASDHDLVFLSCRLADHVIDDAQAARMARANFMQAGRGVVLCVAPDGRPHMQLALGRADCQAEALIEALEALLEQAENWVQGKDTQQAGPRRDPGGSNPAVLLQSV